MAHPHAALNAAAAAALRSSSVVPRAVIGFDGFVDNIIDVVGTRTSPTAYSPVAGISTFAERIAAAAGRSANVELVVRRRKVGGNGPLMAAAMAHQGARIDLVGLLDDPVFDELRTRCARVISLGPPAVTDALEFPDGKLMFGKLGPLEAVDADRLVRVLGDHGGLAGLLATAEGIASVNWTMLLGMPAIWELLGTELARLPGPRRCMFVDLADPAKRPPADLRQALAQLSALQGHVDVILGLNHAECQQVLSALQLPVGHEAELEAGCAKVRAHLGLSMVVGHAREAAAGADAKGSCRYDGFFTATPKLSTGAGDHFNGGCFGALLRGLPLDQSLQVGAATSGSYVRNGESPSLAEVIEFLERHG
jgi:sugar/nucleoside kinase (ribokinase family)